MIKLEFPKANLNAYESAEDKVKALKGQVDTLSTNLQIILDSIDESIGEDAIKELVSPDIDSINKSVKEISDRMADIEDADYGTRIDDMQYYITTVDWKTPQYTISAGSTLTVEGYDVSSVIPDGYDIVASIPLGSGSNQCYVYWCNSTADKKITYQIKNAVSSAITGYAWIRFILRKRLR